MWYGQFKYQESQSPHSMLFLSFQVHKEKAKKKSFLFFLLLINICLKSSTWPQVANQSQKHYLKYKLMLQLSVDVEQRSCPCFRCSCQLIKVGYLRKYSLVEEKHLMFIKTIRKFPLQMQKGQHDRYLHSVKTTKSPLVRVEGLLLQLAGKYLYLKVYIFYSITLLSCHKLNTTDWVVETIERPCLTVLEV